MLTVSQFSVSWLSHRSVSVKTWRHDRSRLGHVLPLIGALAMSEVTREHVEDLVMDLDTRVRRGALSSGTAAKVWGALRRLFDDAVRAKDRALRCLARDPSEGVRGPDADASRTKRFLYPAEATALLSCPSIPKARRARYAVAMYSGARAGEIAAISLASFGRGVLVIRESVDEHGVRGPTKNGEERRVPVEGPLAELLTWISCWRRPEDVFGRDPRAAERLREDLRAAGVTREALFRDDARSKPVTFHDLRATAITWWAVRGDNFLAIQRRAGHSSFATTQRYLREAEDLGEFGETFPQMPEMI